MGCFSYLCKECGEAILSNSFRGENVKLYLLKDGKIIDQMEGEYDSYGRVFTKDLKESIYWKMDWDKVCELEFLNDKSNGIAAIHTKCYKDQIPVTQSEQDPNQGWGSNDELFCNTNPDLEFNKGD